MKLCILFTRMLVAVAVAAPTANDANRIQRDTGSKGIDEATMNSILATIGEAKGIDAATMDSFLATVGEVPDISNNPTEAAADINRCDKCRLAVGRCWFVENKSTKACNREKCDTMYNDCHLCKNLPC